MSIKSFVKTIFSTLILFSSIFIFNLNVNAQTNNNLAFVSSNGSKYITSFLRNENLVYQVNTASNSPRNGLISNDNYYSVSDIGKLNIHDANTTYLKNTISIPYGSVNIVKNYDGSKLYITSPSENKLTIVNTNNLSLNILDILDNPYSLSFNNDYSKLYIGGIGGNGNLSILDTQTETILASISNVKAQSMVGINNQIIGASLNHKAFFINTLDDTIYFLDTGFGKNPFGITISGNKAYITNRSSSEVIVVDIINKTLLSNISIPTNYPNNIQNLSYIASDNYNVYITNFLMGTLTIVDTNTDTIVNTINSGNGARNVDVKNNLVSVINYTDKKVKTWNTTNLNLIQSFNVGDKPLHLILNKTEYKYSY